MHSLPSKLKKRFRVAMQLFKKYFMLIEGLAFKWRCCISINLHKANVFYCLSACMFCRVACSRLNLCVKIYNILQPSEPFYSKCFSLESQPRKQQKLLAQCVYSKAVKISGLNEPNCQIQGVFDWCNSSTIYWCFFRCLGAQSE